MKDLPITIKVAILVALILSLAVISGQFGAEPPEELRSEVSDDRDGDSPVLKPLPAKPVLYPSVPAVLPGLNDRYLFNSDRLFEKVELEEGGGDTFKDGLDEVSYSGSWLVGEIPQGLVSYQEESRDSKRPVRALRGTSQTQRGAAKAATKHKQLKLGEYFMGYTVDKIEKDRIVFRKGDEVVEKYLHAPDKERIKAGSAIKGSTKGPVQSLKRTVEEIVQKSPEQGTVSPVSVVEPRKTMTLSGNSTPPVAKSRNLRADRLLGLVPSLGMPPSSGAPGDPLRR